MKILKFGGTSAGSPEGISHIINILKNQENTGKISVAAVSALSGITDALIGIAGEALAQTTTGISFSKELKLIEKRHTAIAAHFLDGDERKNAIKEINSLIFDLGRILDGVAMLGELSPRTLDLIMSFGERLSAKLLTQIIKANGIKAEFLDTRDLIKTNDDFGSAQYLHQETYSRIKEFFKAQNKTLYIATGFIASTLEGQTSTMGRGGSDLTGAIFAAALAADSLEIWTDVDGIFTANPKLVKNAFPIKEMHYSEAMEISHFGAKVIFPLTIKPLMEKNIPVVIRNTFNPLKKGTLISAKKTKSDFPICGTSSISNVSLIRIQGPGMVGVAGFSARVFGALARRGISVILITQGSSEYSICFAVMPQEAAMAVSALENEFLQEIKSGLLEKPVTEKDLSIIAVVGINMKSVSGISGRFFHALGRSSVNVVAIAQGSSEINISAVIQRNDEEKALNAVHEAFFHSTLRSVNLFQIGTGLIGGTLLEQIEKHRNVLAEKDKIRINIPGLANVDSMVFSSHGLDPVKTKNILNKGQPAGNIEKLDLKKFIDMMISYNLPNACFCDCTASEAVAASYGRILEAGIPIVTPNKKANSGKLNYYNKIINYSRQRRIPYLYETTVCAGLPLISTLRDLYLCGDKVRKIEGVLSGTLSFIFNNFDGKKPFSALVREAKEKGYTEPDPRDDLNAMDTARKALILARECGLSLEFKDVKIEPILPPACLKAKTIEAFFTELQKYDAVIEKRRYDAAQKGLTLRYIALIEGGKASLKFSAEPKDSPFNILSGSDNMVVITTERYSKLPMVIKGPGAGAQVTAGGIFADIVRIARTLV